MRAEADEHTRSAVAAVERCSRAERERDEARREWVKTAAALERAAAQLAREGSGAGDSLDRRIAAQLLATFFARGQSAADLDIMCRVFDVEEGARASMQRARGEREPSVVRSVTSVAALPLKAPLAVGGLALNAFNNVAAMAGMGMPDLTPQEAGRQSLEATRQGDLAEAFVHFLEDAAEKEVGEGGGEDDEVGSGDPSLQPAAWVDAAR